jgi:nicotinamidase-related amidase
VLIAGLDATRCVKATAGGATNRGYQTIVIDDAIATDSGKPLSEVLESYRAMGASVRHSDELLAQNDSVPPRP